MRTLTWVSTSNRTCGCFTVSSRRGWLARRPSSAAIDFCDTISMAVGRVERRREREPRFVAVFGEQQAPVALDLFDLFELAWHDCYGEVTPSPDVVEDMLTLSDGTIGGLVHAALLAVTDWRDLRVAADTKRNQT